MIRIGALKERITLQVPAETPDGAGGFSVDWQDVAEVYAAVSAIAASAVTQDRQRAAAATHQAFIRHRADVAPGMRMVWKGAAYDILSCADRDGRREILALTARRVSP